MYRKLNFLPVISMQLMRLYCGNVCIMYTTSRAAYRSKIGELAPETLPYVNISDTGTGFTDRDILFPIMQIWLDPTVDDTTESNMIQLSQKRCTRYGIKGIQYDPAFSKALHEIWYQRLSIWNIFLLYIFNIVDDYNILP